MRVVARIALDRAHALRFVEFEDRLGAVEVQRTAAAPRFRERVIHAEQRLEPRRERTQCCNSRRLALEQHLVCLAIGEARMTAHHRRIELRRTQLTAARDRHVRRKAQAIDVRLQRAQLVRQRIRQHRQHTAREIHRRAALRGFRVERRARTHVMADVRNRDDQPIARRRLLGVHRIVEVFRIRPVDRDQRQFAQIHTTRRFLRIHRTAPGFRFAQHFGRECGR